MLLLATSLCACQSVQQFESKPPSAEELLTLDPQADLFQWEETIYETNIDWTKSLNVTKHQQVGVIQKTAACTIRAASNTGKLVANEARMVPAVKMLRAVKTKERLENFSIKKAVIGMRIPFVSIKAVVSH